MCSNINEVLGDGIGSVELLEVFGNDLTVVNAARVSFNKESLELNNQDRNLLHYLASNGHISPFFHPQIRLRFKMPLFVAREWFRHTVGFARNEVSRRYVSYDPECWIPPIIREISEFKKQGSSNNEIKEADLARGNMEGHINRSCELYNELIEMKVAPELARTMLPQCMYTEFIETGSLYGYIRLCKLRNSPDAQQEIRFYSQAVFSFLQNNFPASITAFHSTE